jgi:putative endonuclease
MNLPVTNTTQTGIRGENLTVDYLLNQGYELLDKNYRFKKYEIDLVLRDQSTLVVVEVKFRSTDMFCEPWKSVTRKKQQQIIQVANHYVQTKELDYEVRFDVVGIVANENGLQIEHIQDAFYPIA